MKKALLGVIIACCMAALAKSTEKCSLSESEVSAIKTFFNDVKEAVNAKDAERVKKMSGETWKQWVEAMADGERFETFDVLNITTGEQTNAVVLHGMAYGFHVFMAQSASNPDIVVLVADGVRRTEVGQLQGVGNGIVLDGVVRGVSIDEVSVEIKHVVQVVIRIVDVLVIDVKGVA